MTKKFQIQFKGELLPGISQEEALQNLSEAYGVEQSEILPWFENEVTMLREEVGEEEKNEVVQFLKHCGLKVIVTEKPGLDSSIPENLLSPTPPAEDSRNDIPESREEFEDKQDLTEEGFATEETVTFQKDHDTYASSAKPITQITIHPASIAKRLLAYFMDLFVIGFLYSISLSLFFIPFGFVSQETIDLLVKISLSESQDITPEMFQSLMHTILYSLMPLMVIVYSIYFVLFEGILKGASSLGKKVVGIRLYMLGIPPAFNTSTTPDDMQSFSKPTSEQPDNSNLIKQYMLKKVAFKTVTLALMTFILSNLIDSMVPLLGTFLLLFSLFMAFFDKKGLRQTFYDRLSGIFVGEKMIVR